MVMVLAALEAAIYAECEESRVLHRFLRDEQGQDLIENTLLVAAVALASAGIFLSAGGDINTIWQSGSTTLTTAATAVGAVNSSNPPSGNGGGDGGGDGGDGGHHGH